MPYFDFQPIDPDLKLGGNIGPGLENGLDDQVKLASAIEKKTGAAPHAELGRFGVALAQRFAGRPGGRDSRTLPSGFLGAIGAAQVRRGTYPDTIVLKNGPTHDALRGTGDPDADGRFAPLPKIARPVGPRRSNRPEDTRTLQGKLASLGYVPRVTEKPLFPRDAKRPSTPPFHPPGNGADWQGVDSLQTLLDGVRLFQQHEGLKSDALVNPGGPTERALDARNDRARTARLDRLETVSREIMGSDAPEYAAITDRSAADALAGLIVANEVQDARNQRVNTLSLPSLVERTEDTHNRMLSTRDANYSPVLRTKSISLPVASSSRNNATILPDSDITVAKSRKSENVVQTKLDIRRGIPNLKTSSERHRSIIEDTEGNILVEDNPSANSREHYIQYLF